MPVWVDIEDLSFIVLNLKKLLKKYNLCSTKRARLLYKELSL